jgi:hypothetical protein
LNATHWNFSEQLGVRLHHVLGEGSDMEFAFRHWSNAGLRRSNRGQDFMTVTIASNRFFAAGMCPGIPHLGGREAPRA